MSLDIQLWYERVKSKDLGSKSVSAAYVDAKVDGWVLDIGLAPDGVTPFACTRAKDVYHKLRDLSWIRKIVPHLGRGCAVQGELYVPCRPASEVPRALCSDLKSLCFAAFDVPSWNGLISEVTDLFVVEAKLRKMGCSVVPRFHVEGEITATVASSMLKSIRAQIGELRGKYRSSFGYAPLEAHDVEGLVFKGPDGWFKYKETKTVDLIVTGTVDGNGKYVGLVGALVGSVWRDCLFCEICQEWQVRTECPGCGTPCVTVNRLVEVASVSGMDDELREDMGDDDVGRVFEVEYQYLGAGNKLRHPRFKRWRDDKPAEDCTWQSILHQR